MEMFSVTAERRSELVLTVLQPPTVCIAHILHTEIGFHQHWQGRCCEGGDSSQGNQVVTCDSCCALSTCILK